MSLVVDLHSWICNLFEELLSLRPGRDGKPIAYVVLWFLVRYELWMGSLLSGDCSALISCSSTSTGCGSMISSVLGKGKISGCEEMKEHYGVEEVAGNPACRNPLLSASRLATATGLHGSDCGVV